MKLKFNIELDFEDTADADNLSNNEKYEIAQRYFMPIGSVIIIDNEVNKSDKKVLFLNEITFEIIE